MLKTLRFGWLQITGRRISNAKFLNRFIRVTDQHAKLQILKGLTRATQKHKNATYTQEERDPPVIDGRMQVGEWHVSVYARERCRKRAATWQARRRWSHLCLRRSIQSPQEIYVRCVEIERQKLSRTDVGSNLVKLYFRSNVGVP